MPRCRTRPTLITRGQRLATRALALSLVSGVIVGVTGAAGENTTVAPQGVSIQSSAFVRPSSAVPVGATTSVPHTRWHGDGVGQPAVVPTVPVASVPPVPIAVPVPVAGDGNGQGHDHGNGNGNGQDHGNGNGNGDGNGQGQGQGAGAPAPGDQGPNPGSPQVVPPTDPGTVVPTGDGGGDNHDHGHHRGDGQGAGNSGQTNVPLPVPTSNPVVVPTPTPTSGGTVAHTPVTAPVTAPTPVTTPATGVTSQPTTKPTTTRHGNGFKVSGLVPVSQKKNRKSSHGSSSLLSAANSGISVPLSRVAADLAHLAGSTGLGAGAASTGTGSGKLSASQTAAADAARAKAAQQALARKKAADGSKSSSLPQVVGTTVTQIVRFIPSSIWIALAASLGLALMGLTAAVTAGRRARRNAHRVAEVSAVALTDPLTGVLNRRGFIEAAERELDRAIRHGRPFTLSYIDVRGLKRVNDGEGHLAGDQLLTAAAGALTHSVRAHDVVGRLGGDEFGVLLAEQTTEEAAQVTERISDQVTVTRAELAFAAHWDLTVGTASFPQDGTTIDELLAAADRRLYEKRGIELATAR